MPDVRLIDANALKTEMADDLAATIRMSEMRKTDMAVRVLNKIDEANTVDAVTVIRCRECIHRGTDNCPMIQEDYYYDEDDGSDYVMHDHTEDNGFCHKGEKKDGGTEG